jgi:hypothetical protein
MPLTIARPQVQIDEDIKLHVQHATENCTIVHCIYTGNEESMAVRIWPSTFLVQDDGNRRKLIKAFNISLMPDWTYHHSGEARFTLLFEGLTKDCSSFYLLEDIPEAGGFYSDTMIRNSTDVYRAEIFC